MGPHPQTSAPALPTPGAGAEPPPGKPQGYVRLPWPSLLAMSSADLAAYFDEQEADLADAIAHGLEDGNRA
jgi:hypothetical protein